MDRRVLIDWLRLFSRNPSIIKYFLEWRKSLKEGRNSLTDRIPWIVYESKEWLDRHLQRRMKVFEWGSGGSTIYLSKRVKVLVSIEHDSDWFQKVKSALKKGKVKTIKYYLIKPELKKKLVSFEKYCNFINRFENNLFDLIIVDGRSRNLCIKKAIPKIRRRGFLLLDNSERREYKKGMRFINNWERKDFYGPGPYNSYFWQTSIFQKP